MIAVELAFVSHGPTVDNLAELQQLFLLTLQICFHFVQLLFDLSILLGVA